MVKQKVLLDTNILIDYLRQKAKEKAKSQLELVVENLSIIPLISVASVQELFAGQSSKRTKEERKIRKILPFFKIISINSRIAEVAGKIMRDTQPIVQFADAQIAATAILEKAFLLTRNKKDFAKIKGLKFYPEI